MSKKSRMVFLIGVFIIATFGIVSHYTPVPDFYKGSLLGIGMGLMILALIKRKHGPLAENKK